MSDFNAITADWLLFKVTNDGCALRTKDKYAQVLLRLDQYLGERSLCHLSASTGDLEDFCGAYLYGLTLSARSRRVAVSCLRGFFMWLYKRGLRTDNPAIHLRPPKAGRRLPICMQLKDAEKLIHQPDTETFHGVRDLAMLLLMIGCGIRVSGLVGLNQRDLIFSEDAGGEELFIRIKAKGDNDQFIPAPDDTRLAIRAYLGHPGLYGIDRSLENGDKVLFISTAWRGIPLHEYSGELRRISARAVQDMVMRYGLRAGISQEATHPHALRHLFATELVEEDTNMLIVQNLMGHVRPDTTAIYNHTAMRKLRRVVNESGPLAKMKTPLSGLAAALKRQVG